MRFSSILTLLSLCVLSYSYVINGGVVKVNSKAVEFGEFVTQEIKQIVIDSPKEKIEVELTLGETLKKSPHQLVVNVGNRKGLTESFVPSFKDGKVIKLSIPVSKLSEVLKVQDKLFLDVIIGEFDNSKNVYKHLVELIPSSNLKAATNYKPKERLGYKPEIHHQFRGEEATVKPIIPVVFILGATVLLFGLLVSWPAVTGSDFFGTLRFVTKKQLGFNVVFLTSILGLEGNFIYYYLGQSIFSTILNVFLIGLPAIYFGSRVLRSLADYQKAGRI